MTDSEFNRRLVRTVAAIASALVLLYALWEARDALVLIYVSALIAMGFAPLVRLIQRPGRDGRSRGLPRLLAILSIYLAVIGVFILVGLLVIPPLVEQATTLWARLPEHFAQAQEVLIRHNLMSRTITWQEAVQQAPAGSGGNAVATVFTAVSSLVGGLLGAITIVILSFYLLIEGESLMRYVLQFVPDHQRGSMSIAARDAVLKVSAWLRGQVTLAVVMGSFTAIGLGLLHVPYFYVIALVAAVGETIPVLGPIIGGAAAVAVSLSVSPRLAITVAIYFTFLHQLEANILVPKVMERRVGVSPVGVMIALLIGASLYGLVGAILAIPSAAILSVLLDQFAGRRSEPAA
jgi:predicted PurR-regulated permease PerM